MQELTFRSQGDTCTAWHVLALTSDLARAQGRPCVVTARGVCGSRERGLISHAARFTAEGYDVLLFRLRRAASPRCCPPRAGRLPGRDRGGAPSAGGRSDRIVLWGAARDADHVARVAAADERVAGVIAMRRTTADELEGAHRALVDAR